MASTLENTIATNPVLQDMQQKIYNLSTQIGKLECLQEYDMEFPDGNCEMNEYGQAIDDAEDSKDMYMYVMADSIGLENLRTMRKSCGATMHQLYCKQQDAYKEQKSRYEACKARGYFTEEDRCFIQQKKLENTTAWSEWDQLKVKRDELCQMIEVLDPEDPDTGFDEE